jgi:hypothetical protein
MTGDESEKAWNIRALGALTPRERGDFYDDLSEDDPEDHLSLPGGTDSKLYENPRLEVSILDDDGSLVPAEGRPATSALRDSRVNVYLEKYFVRAMPGRRFDLQLAVSSRHHFDDRAEPDRVSHTLVVGGVLGDYATYLSEPVFRGLRVSDTLALDIAVTFLSDRSTDRLLSVLKAPELRQGVELLSAFNPVFGMVTTYVRGLVESLASAKRNQAITDAHLTFTTSPGRLSLSLVEGTYVLSQPAVGGDETMLESPRYDSDRQRLVVEGSEWERNYLVVRVERMD